MALRDTFTMPEQKIIDSLIVFVLRDTPFFYGCHGMICFLGHFIGFMGDLAHTFYKFSLILAFYIFFLEPLL